MISKQKLSIILVAVLFLLSLGFSLYKHSTNNSAYKYYKEGLQKYEKNNYSQAYKMFGKVSRFAKIKPAAVYRQAICAEKLEDYKTAERRYKDLATHSNAYSLSVRAKYLRAKILFDSEKYKKASREFKNIIKKYPDTDYALASQYYLGLIEIEKLHKIKNEKKQIKQKKKIWNYFKEYITKAPTGKFTINCIQKLEGINFKLNNEDNLLIAKVYQQNQRYKEADKYLKASNISFAWPYLVKNAYELKDFEHVKYYTEQGLKGIGSDQIPINTQIDEQEQNDAIYKAIDLYLKVSNSPREAISYLLSISIENKNGHDYLLYKDCTNLPSYGQTACFNSLFYKYPDGQFGAEALANIYYDKIKNRNYEVAKKYGKAHLNKYKNVKSSPKVLFWLAKIAERTKNYEEAKSYYKKVINKYPDDYYAYHAFLNLNRFRYFRGYSLTPKKVEFPYSGGKNTLIFELLKVSDYGLINQLYGEDDFITSWLMYKQGNFSSSARIARDAMDKLEVKPPRTDLRWRLVYPLHYVDEINKYSDIYGNDSVLILSIIREESYFNPYAKSPVGARGLMQLMPATAQEAANRAGISLPNSALLSDVNININLGNVYYANLKKMFSGNDILAILSYNGGAGSVQRWKNSLYFLDLDDFVEQVPFGETQNYLKKVYKSYWNYLRIYDGIKF